MSKNLEDYFKDDRVYELGISKNGPQYELYCEIHTDEKLSYNEWEGTTRTQVIDGFLTWASEHLP